jgi:hypothetical protein
VAHKNVPETATNDARRSFGRSVEESVEDNVESSLEGSAGETARRRESGRGDMGTPGGDSRSAEARDFGRTLGSID